MKVFRWRLWALMGLVLACALGLKAVLMVRARQAAIERRARLLNPAAPPPQTPEEQAEAVELLGDPDSKVRQIVVQKLAASSSTAPELVGPLIGMLESQTEEFTWKTRWSPGPNPGQALQRYRFSLPAIAPRLAPALANPDWYVRSAALAVLLDAAARPGPGAVPNSAVAPLLGALADADPRNRLRAAEVLARLDPAARHRAGAVLLGQLRDPPDCWALLAVVSLARFDPEARAAAAILAGRLDAGDLRTRLDHLYLLGRLGPRASPAVPAIVRAMAAPDARDYPTPPFGQIDPGMAPMPWINIGVFETGFGFPHPEQIGTLGAAVLGQVGPDAVAQAVALLIGMVRDGDEGRQRAAARALGDLGPRAASAFPDLLALVERTTGTILEQRGDWMVAAQLTRTLQQVVPGDDPRLVAALVRLLETGTRSQRNDAALVLNQVEPPPIAAVPALVRAARDESQVLRWSATWALGRYAGTDREAAIPALLVALRDDNDMVHFQAAESLSHLGGGADAVIPAAIERLGEEHRKTEAVAILGRYGPAAAPALPALRALQSDPDVFVREAVARAIPLIDPPAPAPGP